MNVDFTYCSDGEFFQEGAQRLDRLAVGSLGSSEAGGFGFLNITCIFDRFQRIGGTFLSIHTVVMIT